MRQQKKIKINDFKMKIVEFLLGDKPPFRPSNRILDELSGKKSVTRKRCVEC